MQYLGTHTKKRRGGSKLTHASTAIIAGPRGHRKRETRRCEHHRKAKAEKGSKTTRERTARRRSVSKGRWGAGNSGKNLRSRKKPKRQRGTWMDRNDLRPIITIPTVSREGRIRSGGQKLENGKRERRRQPGAKKVWCPEKDQRQ